MQREHTRLCAEAEKDQYACRQYLGLRETVRRRACALERLRQPGKRQRSHSAVEEHQTHEQHETADHRNKQVGVPGADRVPGLFMDYPCKGCKGQHLKEHKRRHQVCREHDALNSSQRKQHEKLVPSQVFLLVGKIFRGKHRCPDPHDRGDHSVHCPEPRNTESQSASGQYSRDHKGRPDCPFRGRIEGRCTRQRHKGQRQSKYAERQEKSRVFSGFFTLFPYGGRSCRSGKRSENDRRNKHPCAPFRGKNSCSSRYFSAFFQYLSMFCRQSLPSPIAVSTARIGPGNIPNRILHTPKA